MLKMLSKVEESKKRDEELLKISKDVKVITLLGLLKIAPFISNLLIAYLILRVAPVDVYAEYLVAVSWVFFLVTPISYALNTLVVKEISQGGGFSILRNYQLIIILSFILFILLTILVYKESVIGNYVLYFCMSSLALVMMITAVISGILRGVGKTIKSQLADISIRPIFLFVVVVWYLLNIDITTPWEIVATYLLSSVVMLIVLVLIANKSNESKSYIKTKQGERRSQRPAIIKTLLVSVPSYANLWYMEGVIVLLGMIGNSNEILSFKISLVVSSLISVPLGLVNVVYARQIASSLENKVELISIMGKARLTGSVMSMLIFFVLIIGGEVISNFYTQDDNNYFNITIFYVLSFGFLFSAYVGPVGQLMIMMNNEKVALKMSVISMIISILIFFLVVDRLGATGAAIAVVVGNSLVNLLFYREYKKYISSF